MYNLEKDVENEIKRVCKMYGIFVKKIGARERNGVNSGVPDLLLFKDGTYILIEAKCNSGSVFQPSQTSCFSDLKPYIAYAESNQVVVYKYPHKDLTQPLIIFLNDIFHFIKDDNKVEEPEFFKGDYYSYLTEKIHSKS